MSKHTPDGGWGWMIVAGCFLTTVCTRAVTRCVSIFFMEFQAYFSRDYSSTAWIHSLLDCTTMLCAPLGSYIGNRLSPRCAIMIGGFLSSSGLVLSSLASSLEFLYVTLGILTGVGFALSYTPAIAMVGSYFSERKALAYGIAMSGSGIGTFFLAPGVQLLIEIFSWKGALLILGGLVSHLCVCGAVMKPLRAKRRKQRDVEEGEKVDLLHVEAKPRDKHVERRIVEVKHVDADKMMKELEANSEDQNLEESRIDQKRSGKQGGEAKTSTANPLDHPREGVVCLLRKIALREYSFLFIPDFLLLLVSFLFLAYGCSVPFVYLVPYSLSRGVSSQQAALLMSILGVSGIVGTITFGWIADRKCLRQYRVASYMLAVASEGLSCLSLPLLASFSLLVPFSLFYGYFDGAYVALIPVVTSDTVSSSHLSSALGIVYFLHAIPYLISPPIGGLLVDQTDSYTATFILSGVSLICSAVILAAVRMILRCSRGRFDYN